MDPTYGKVYHMGNAKDMQALLDAEGGYWYHAHPRTKGTAGYPDVIFNEAFAKNDQYLGVAFKTGMGKTVGSRVRMAVFRRDRHDEQHDREYGSAAEVHHRRHRLVSKGPGRRYVSNFPVNYLKIDRAPGPDDDLTPM